jgi:hypothetical protein
MQNRKIMTEISGNDIGAASGCSGEKAEEINLYDLHCFWRSSPTSGFKVIN